MYQSPKKHFFSRCPSIEAAEEPMDQLIDNYKRSTILKWGGKLVGWLLILGVVHVAGLVLLGHKKSVLNALNGN